MATYLRTNVPALTPAELDARDVDDPSGERSIFPEGKPATYGNRGGSLTVSGTVALPTGHRVRVTVEGVTVLSDGRTLTNAGTVKSIEAMSRHNLPAMTDADIEEAGGAVVHFAITRGLLTDTRTPAYAAA